MRPSARHRREDARQRSGGSSSTSSPTRTIRVRITRAPARRSGARPGTRHALREQHGHHRNDHGRVALSQGAEPGGAHRRLPAQTRLMNPRHPQVARRLPAAHLRPHVHQSRRSVSQGDAENDAASRTRGGHLRRHLVGRRAGRRAAHSTRGRQCDHRVHCLRPRRPPFRPGVFPG